MELIIESSNNNETNNNYYKRSGETPLFFTGVMIGIRIKLKLLLAGNHVTVMLHAMTK
jgi:hypothetical protein